MLIKRYIVRVLMLCFRVKPVDKNKVVFISFSGRGFGDNSKAVALKLMEKYPGADIVWATKDGSENLFPRVYAVSHISLPPFIRRWQLQVCGLITAV